MIDRCFQTDLGSLDSSLKRNTAFIKRLRTSLNATDSATALLKEVNLLSLEKYTSELVSACFEGLSRCKTGSEMIAATEVRIVPSRWTRE
jgi:regulator of nonsense transcripts 2